MCLHKLFSRKSSQLATMLIDGFPFDMENAIRHVVNKLPQQTYSNIRQSVTEGKAAYFLSSGTVKIPARIYLLEIKDNAVLKMNSVEKTILHCIYSRSCNGYTREKHIRELLSDDLPEWAIPYIVKACDEYVVEILQAVYDSLKTQSNDSIKQFCADNRAALFLSYNRMVSYWNAYYRKNCRNLEDYIGYKLFVECFGITNATN